MTDRMQNEINKIENALKGHKSYKVIGYIPQVFFHCTRQDGYCDGNHGERKQICGPGSNPNWNTTKFYPGDVIDKPIDEKVLSRKIQQHLIKETEQ